MSTSTNRLSMPTYTIMTIITSMTAILALAALALFGGPTLYGLSVIMLFGITIGTYSSIYIAAPVIMLGYDYWLTHFGGDSSVVGRALRISGRQAQVVGVLQRAPFFPRKIDALMNMSISAHHVSAMMVQGRTHRMTEMIARLAPGVTVEQARTEVAAFSHFACRAS